MAIRNIRFPLILKNGVEVRRNLEELRENFDLDKIIGYFHDGKLIEWLEVRYLKKEAEALKMIDDNDSELDKKICDILGVDSKEYVNLDPRIPRINEIIEYLKQRTDDAEIIENANITALDQDDLYDLIDIGTPKIYLCGNEEFDIPIDVSDKHYIGILGTPKINIDAQSKADIEVKNIAFNNVEMPWSNDKPNESLKYLIERIDETLEDKNYFEPLESIIIFPFDIKTKQDLENEIGRKIYEFLVDVNIKFKNECDRLIDFAKDYQKEYELIASDPVNPSLDDLISYINDEYNKFYKEQNNITNYLKSRMDLTTKYEQISEATFFSVAKYVIANADEMDEIVYKEINYDKKNIGNRINAKICEYLQSLKDNLIKVSRRV